MSNQELVDAAWAEQLLGQVTGGPAVSADQKFTTRQKP